MSMTYCTISTDCSRHAFCPFHETQFGAKCNVCDCQAPKINPSQACQQHQPEWQKYIQTHSHENLLVSGVTEKKKGMLMDLAISMLRLLLLLKCEADLQAQYVIVPLSDEAHF